MSKKFDDIRQRASQKFNALPDEDRKQKAGLGYSLAQLTTIQQIRIKNKEAWKRHDESLAVWQSNIEKTIEKEYLS